MGEPQMMDMDDEIKRLRVELDEAKTFAEKAHNQRNQALETLGETARQRDEAQDRIDEEWLGEIGQQWRKFTGEPWETRDGESREEGLQANITALFQVIEDRTKERDAERAKCAEMLKCLQEHHGWHLEGPKVFFSDDGKPCPIETDLCEAYVESEMCDRTVHALSGECGKGWKSPEEHTALEAKLTARIGVIDSFITACGFNVNDGFEINAKKIFGLVGEVVFWHRLAKDCAVGIGPHGEYMTADDKCAAIEAAEKLYDCGKGFGKEADVFRRAAVLVQAIGPCSGTKDWNDSRRCAIRDAASILNAEADRLEKQSP